MNNETKKRLDYLNEQLSISMSKKILEPEHNGICNHCGEVKNSIMMRKRDTAYCDKEKNYIESCLECFKEDEEYWAEQWREYYSCIWG